MNGWSCYIVDLFPFLPPPGFIWVGPVGYDIRLVPAGFLRWHVYAANLLISSAESLLSTCLSAGFAGPHLPLISPSSSSPWDFYRAIFSANMV